MGPIIKNAPTSLYCNMAPIIKNGTHVQLNDGRLMPLVGLGCWQAKSEELSNAVTVALQNGYRHIDTAYSYLNEEAVGAGIRRWGGDRKDVSVVTKLPMIGMGEGNVETFLKKSLTNLDLDYVDLFLIHCPVGLQYVDDETIFPGDGDGNLLIDYTTNHVGLWKEMQAVQAAGLTKSIGVSNFSVRQLRRLMALPGTKPAVNQLEMHVQFQQLDMQRYCHEVGIVLTSYGTLGSPGRAGTPFEQGCTIPSLLQHPVVALVAEAHKVTPAQVLLRYFVQQGIVVIPKSVTPERIATNIKVFDWSLSDIAMAALRTLEIGEAARSFNFITRRGTDQHPECPVAIAPKQS